jgi:hypothetical protein
MPDAFSVSDGDPASADDGVNDFCAESVLVDDELFWATGCANN